jgi:hypothetical protein
MAVVNAVCDKCGNRRPLMRTYSRDGKTLRMLCVECRANKGLAKEVKK